MKFKRIILILILIFTLFFICTLFTKYYRFNNYINRFASYCIYPAMLLENNFIAPFKNVYNNFFTNQDLSRQILDLHEQNYNLLAENIKLKSTSNYYENIKELIDFTERYDEKEFLIAQILVRRFDMEHYFLVDIGSNKGIENDMPVIYKNCLIGKVINVYPNYSKVLLITDSKCKVAAYCGKNIDGIHEGANNLDLTYLSFVNHLEAVNIGEEVLSSGNGLVFPRGFGLGFVKNIEAVDGFYLKISLQPHIDFKHINYCLILKR